MSTDATQPGSVARRRLPHKNPQPNEQALITIHGRVFPGTVRRRTWSEKHRDWRWSVDVCVDDRRVLTWVSADQIELVPDDR